MWSNIHPLLLLDLLTLLSDCRHETVEKIMERRISGVSYMCWVYFHNGIWGCGFFCARLMTLYFVSIFVSILCLSFRLPRRGLSRPFLTTTGYHACVYIQVTSPELSRSTTHVHRVITPAISNSYFVVFISPASTPLLLLPLHHHRAPHATSYSTTIPMRIHSSRHNAFNTGLIPTNTALTTLEIPSVVVPQHAVIPLNAGSCLCSLGIRYRTGCLFVSSREYSSEFSFFTLTLGISRYSNFRYFTWRSVISSIINSNDSLSTRSYAGPFSSAIATIL